MAEMEELLIGALLRRRGAGGGYGRGNGGDDRDGVYHRNAPFVFIVDKISYARFLFCF